MTKLEKFQTILALLKSLSADYIDRLISILSNEQLVNPKSVLDYVNNERFAAPYITDNRKHFRQIHRGLRQNIWR